MAVDPFSNSPNRSPLAPTTLSVDRLRERNRFAYWREQWCQARVGVTGELDKVSMLIEICPPIGILGPLQVIDFVELEQSAPVADHGRDPAPKHTSSHSERNWLLRSVRRM